MGKKIFVGEEEEWLRSKLPAYFSLPHNRPSAEWLENTANEFLRVFQYPKPNDPKPLDKYRQEIIPRWFYNSPKRKNTPVGIIDLKAKETNKSKGLGAIGVCQRAPVARELFDRGYQDVINTEAWRLREDAGENHQSHPKFRNPVLTNQWEKLPKEKQKEYQSKVGSNKEAAKQPLSRDQLYKNQAALQDKMSKYLQSLIGFDIGQVGNAMFHIQAAYRGEKNVIKTFSLVIAPKDTVPPGKLYNESTEYM